MTQVCRTGLHSPLPILILPQFCISKLLQLGQGVLGCLELGRTFLLRKEVLRDRIAQEICQGIQQAGLAAAVVAGEDQVFPLVLSEGGW